MPAWKNCWKNSARIGHRKIPGRSGALMKLPPSGQVRHQLRSSGDPYLTHLLEVAHILADMRLDATTLTAALLHDVVEDTEFPLSRIEERFGTEVARLVEGVTKISRLNMMAPEVRQAETPQDAAGDGERRSRGAGEAGRPAAQHAHPGRPGAGKQQRIARETIDIYAPIAHRLGMGNIRNELEILRSAIWSPRPFMALKSRWPTKRRTTGNFWNEVQAHNRGQTGARKGSRRSWSAREADCIRCTASWCGRSPVWSRCMTCWRCARSPTASSSCYAALGVVHHIWHPVPGRIQGLHRHAAAEFVPIVAHHSLHGGQPLEVQIRTQEMHRIAEEGVAAHWKYKGGKPGSEDDDQRITWMRQLIEWSQEPEEPGEFRRRSNVDFAPVEVYAFTPKGRVLELAARGYSGGFCVRGAHRGRGISVLARK